MAETERALLPRDVRPKKYRLTLSPDLSQYVFTGHEEIHIEILEPTSRIVLHAAELRVESAEVKQNGAAMEAARILLDEKKETIQLEFPRIVPLGPAELRLTFSGKLNDQMRGFYRSLYTVQEETRAMAVTQFEATDARRAFPCWDEPAIKATFEVTLEIPPDRLAISNMPPLETRTDPAGKKVVRFAETPIMSTYLLAFIVGEFDFVEGKTKEGIQVRVYTPVKKKEQGLFALDVAIRTLSFFQDYFEVPYPLPKMDLIAIPDFAAGAMENWGAVTYRETAILVDPEQSSQATRQRVAVVIAHELAHQWFGNLVTMEWWTHLWLNEGFASWIEYLAVDHLFPEWDIWTQFVYSDFSRALGQDSLENTHPIEVEVKDPNEIGEIFDAISYSKGASIIRMLEAFLGAEPFRRGLSRYLKRHQYGNATTEDLWHALAEASGKPVKEMMDTWTKQSGYPLLSLEEEGRSFSLRQSRFFLAGRAREEEERDPAQWSVPVGVLAPRQPEPSFFILRERRAPIDLPGNGKEWIKLNPKQTGFYRVNYPSKFWGSFGKVIQSKAVFAPDRLGLENDAFALARAGFLPASQALTLASTYSDESDYTVWADLATNLSELTMILPEEPVYRSFRLFACSLYRPTARRLSWEAQPGEGHLAILLRSLLLAELGGYGDEATIAEARRRFARFLKNPRDLRPDLRFPVYRLEVENGDEESYEAVLGTFRKSDLHEEKMRALRALGFSQQPKLLQRTLELSLSPEVRPQDTPLAIGSVAWNRRGRELAWKFLQSRWEEFNRRYGRGGFLLARLISSTTSDFASEEKAAEVEEFFRAHPAPAAERTIRQSIERIHSNAAWLKRDLKSIEEWLADNAGSQI